MASVFKRKGLGILSAIVAFCGLVMIAAALITEYWVNADLRYEVQVTENNRTSTKEQDGGTKHFGLFSGSTAQNLGLGSRERDFKVIDEFENVANDKVVWATVGFCVLSFPFILIGIVMSCYNEFSKPNLVLFGSIGICIVHGLAFIMLLVAVCLYASLFEIQLKKNVLRPEDKKVGFESTGRARLDYSFWMLLGSAGVVLLSPLLFLLSKVHLTHYFKTSHQTKEPAPTDHGVMLY
ncbi:clarin-2 [Exaiptasia diaphana]|uniref:Uncharacterized protein n=1 Tax=Exaiptasia diaphana TaxID=2652724 RepID=A0A913X3B1_EXADI|nr:clarin-2 [Exaiptasia diaphana]